nr:hypothetical protein [Escherichia coli]
MWHQDLAQWQNMSWRDHRQAAAKGGAAAQMAVCRYRRLIRAVFNIPAWRGTRFQQVMLNTCPSCKLKSPINRSRA